MPMPNDNFQWRPNDNGSLTNLRYNLEAEKWVTAVNNAQSKLPKGNYAAQGTFIGNVIALPLLLIFFIIMIPIRLIREVFGYNIKLFMGDEPTGKVRGTYQSTEEFQADLDAIRERHRGKGRKRNRTWDELTSEEQNIVRMVRAETARAKALAQSKAK